MSHGLVVITEPKVELQSSCYCQNLVAEFEAITFLEEEDETQRLQFIEMTSGMDEECQFHPAEIVLDQIKLLQEAVERSDDQDFEFGKEPLLMDLDELSAAVTDAGQAGVKVALSYD